MEADDPLVAVEASVAGPTVLRCRTCGASPEPPGASTWPPRWAARTGVGPVEWTTTADRAASRPSPGGQAEVLVGGPFTVGVGQPLGLLFESASGRQVGYDEAPQDLVEIAVLTCVPEAVTAIDDTAARTRVRVVGVDGVDTAWERFAPVSTGSLDWLLNGSDAAQRHAVELAAHHLRYVSWTAQGDLGAWAVIRDTGRDEASLLFLVEWGRHDELAAVGNRVLTRREHRLTRELWPGGG